MKKGNLKIQIIVFCFTLLLLSISMFVFKNMKSSDYVLIVVAVLELIGIILTLVKK